MTPSIPTNTHGYSWQAPTPEALEPELPGYEIISLLGRGGMGAVYKARQKSLDREVAIKVLPPTVDDGGMSFAARFVAEARAMARLEHPGIIPVYDAGQTASGMLYFVMQYVQGTDVAQMIRSSGRLPPKHAYAIAAHVCEALAYAHENGLIHRDIKPANIMVDTQGRVKVADFGLVKAVTEEAGFTQSHLAMGTQDFVAPEAMTPGMMVDARADLYALGVMLYQMLTGQIPRGVFKPASVVVPGIDTRFDEIIYKAMQVDRNERHCSAMEMRRHLDALLQPQVPAPDLRADSDAHPPKQAAALVPMRAAQRAANHGADRRPAAHGALLPGLGLAAVVGMGAFFLLSGRQTEERSEAGDVAEQAAAPRVVASVRRSTEVTPAAPLKVATVVPTQNQPVIQHPLVEAANVKPLLMIPRTPPVEIKPATASSIAAPVSPPRDGTTSKTALPAELAALDAQFIKLKVERVSAPYAADLAMLNTSYLGGIAKKITEEKAAGHLDGILSLEAEQQRLAAKEEVPQEDDGKTPASLQTLRGIYRTAQAKLAATREANLRQLTESLDKRLAQMESDFTKGDRVADAKVVRGYREELAGEALDSKAVSAKLAPPSAPPPQSQRKSGPSLPPAMVLALKDGVTNSLGMKFTLVKGMGVLFCIHEVRYQDYAAYAAAVKSVDGAWKDQSADGFAPEESQAEHPVTKVGWEDAQKFCAWLSKKEGRTYRLPTDEEWSFAVGLEQEKRPPGATPAMLSQKENTEFPWGGDFPPKTKDRAGNYSDESRKIKAPRTGAGYLDGYEDGFVTTAPVMSFKPNKAGLYDMGGNVWEWCEDGYDAAGNDRVLRGASWTPYERGSLLSSYRAHATPGYRGHNHGFRCVLVPDAGAKTAAARPLLDKPALASRPGR
ncbi:MAG: protein kinase domain-containing protein [Prosthecobacter sp.]|uniref:protein kinase domain-containing protein n=1 Tax=Prosthecobacter sp. TaxID=1965333 RepID=UPI0038FF048D